MAQQSPEETPWHAAFPTPTASLSNSTLSSISAPELRELVLAQPELEQREFLVVDVRRTDFEVRFISRSFERTRKEAELTGGDVGCSLPGGCRRAQDAFIKGAVNFPAHSFYPTLPSVLPILSRYRTVIFHCQSSQGRGPRCAGWYQDALDQAGIARDVSRAVVLAGGIKEWVRQFGDEREVTVKL
ncbi:SPOSA6832_00650, partial [Sporobolomyces salmonicolor]